MLYSIELSKIFKLTIKSFRQKIKTYNLIFKLEVYIKKILLIM